MKTLTSFSVLCAALMCAPALAEPPGDYNRDGILDERDLDLQAAEMKKDPANQDVNEFDHNDDNIVDIADRLIWLHSVRNTWVGDANLDSEFNSSDLTSVFQAGKYETDQMAGWVEGDWDGDMRFSSSDHVVAFQYGGYERGFRNPGRPAVPEPSSVVLGLVGVLGLLTLRRRHS